MSAVEINFDGLVGPTHNYAGLSYGNVASAANRDQVARPRAAALQGLAKMRALLHAGLPQGVFAPVARPDLRFLRSIGFSGSDAAVWEAAMRTEPSLARQALAASSMWTANAATVSPSADCADGRLHFTTANLATMLHRFLEGPHTERQLQRVFPDTAHFAVHPPLPAQAAFTDEGAANHMRLCGAHGAAGVEIFVYGREAGGIGTPERFPARQTLESVRAIARAHGLDPGRTIFARQSAKAIDAGAFHNDVVAVASEQVLFFHADAFADPDALRAEIAAKAAGLFVPIFVEVPADRVSLEDAIASYLFNAQLVRFPGQARLTLIAPREVEETPAVAAYLADLTAGQGPIGEVRTFDLRESMRNGGGPACLRLRVVATPQEMARINPGFLLDDARIDRLEAWVSAHYRETYAPADLADPSIVREVHEALDALTGILPLGSDFYEFQRA
ncbi:MAG: N-succinylarginine dihydrolase [Caulobacterales bacterium]